MKKLLFIAPHLSTGGLPQYLTKKIELLKNEFEIYLVEWVDCTGGILVVTKNKIKNLVDPNKFFTLGEDKQELISLINQIQPDIIHLEEIPEFFMDNEIAKQIYIPNRKYSIIETSHDSSFNTDDKRFFPDKFMFVSQWQINQYRDINIPSVLVEYPIEYTERPNREEALRNLQLDPAKKHVLHVGLYTSRKNQAEFFEYARQFPDVEFHSLGNRADNFKWYWEPLAQNTPPNLTWWNERTDVDKFYQAMDLFLFTSRGHENDKETMPLVIREAISYQIPTLIYNLPVYLDYFNKFPTINYLEFDNFENNCKKIKFWLDIVESNPNEEVFILSTYPINQSITETTLKTINSIQIQGYKVIVTSHIPVPREIEEAADYVVVDRNNILTKHSYYSNYWADHSDHKVHINLRGNDNDVYHGPSVHSNYVNGAALAKNLGLKKAYFINFDYALKSSFYIDHISNILNTKKAFFGKYRAYEGDTLYTYFLGADLEFFLDHIPQIFFEQDYNNLQIKWGSESNGLENMWYHAFKNSSNKIYYEPQEIFEHNIEETFTHLDFSQVEYYTVLSTNIPNTFAPYVRISNSNEHKLVQIIVKDKDNNVLFFDELNIEGKTDYYKVLPYQEGLEVEFSINNYVKEIKNLKIPVSNLEFNGNVEVKNYTPNIKLMHLVTEPESNPKEIRSYESIIDFCKETGIKYEQRINKIWTETPPKDTCNRPNDVQDVPGYYKLAPGHYGCYRAHTNAILSEDNKNYDYVLIFEGDVIIDSNYQELYNSLIRFSRIAREQNQDIIGFGNPYQNRNLNGPKIEDVFTNVTPFIPAQSYLINNDKLDFIQNKIKNTKWDAFDMWVCNVAQLKVGTTEKIYTKHLPGFSIIEQEYKGTDENSPLIYAAE